MRGKERELRSVFLSDKRDDKTMTKESVQLGMTALNDRDALLIRCREHIEAVMNK